MNQKLTALLAAGMFVLTATNDTLGDQARLDVSPAYTVLKSGEKQNAWVRVGITGFELKTDQQRPPINVVIVLDKSGSMKGEKIDNARKAAIDAIQRLRADDIVSIVTYDTTVNVLVPATKLTDKSVFQQAIERVQAGGGTALFAGVSKGAAEIRKFIDQERVNRIILLSDGLANEGPSSPSELGALGASLMKESISVSTLGLGLDYNEDLMAQLAARSGGNHQFIERATELADVFNREFDEVTSVVAKNVSIRIQIPNGIRPVRVLGNTSEISGQQIHINLNDLYSGQNRHVVMELELPAGEHGQKQPLAKVTATYHNMQSGETDKLNTSAAIKFSDDQAAVEASLERDVMEDVVAFVSNEQNRLATDFLDAGDMLKCVTTLRENDAFLKANADKLDSIRLRQIIVSNGSQIEALLKNDRNRARKDMRYLQNAIEDNTIVIDNNLVEPPQVQEPASPNQR